MKGGLKHLDLAPQQMLCPCTLGCSALRQCFLPALFSNHTEIYFSFFFSIGRMRLSQSLLDNNMMKYKFSGTGLQKKADSEGPGRGEKGKEKQDKKTMILHIKMLCRKP